VPLNNNEKLLRDELCREKGEEGNVKGNKKSEKLN
jgi:hypothetical protein